MAVTKIRRISSWTLILVSVLSLAIMALFFFGGNEPPLNGEWKYPTYTGEVLFWAYFLLGICALSMLLFGITQFAFKLKTNFKSSIMVLIVITAFVLLHVFAYSIGDTTPVPGINEDSQKFNVPGWLKITEMWMYVMYTLIGLASIAMIWGAIKKAMSK